MASSVEQASTDLKVARLVMNKFGEVFDNFQSHAFSVVALSEQWRNLQSSFGMVHASMASRVKELELKERELGHIAQRLENMQREVELRQKRLDSGESSLSERVMAVELREKQIRECCEVMELEKRQINERCSALQSKEKKVMEGLKRVEAMEVEEKRFEEHRRALEMRKKQIDDRCQAIELEENRIHKRCIELDRRERELDGRCKSMEMREKEVNERFDKLELKEKEMNVHSKVRCDELELKEKQMDERSEALKSKEKEIDQRCKMLELRVDERGIRVQVKEKEVYERCKVVELNEKQMNGRLKVLELEKKEINQRCKMLELKEKRIDERERRVEVKEKEGYERCRVVELNEKQMNERLKALELEKKEIDQRCKILELKEKRMDERERRIGVKEREIDERCNVVELNEKQMNERLKALELEKKEIVQRFKILELKEKRIDKHERGLKMQENEVDERCNVVELNEKQMNERLKALEWEQKRVNGQRKLLELQEKHTKDVCQARELKEKRVSERCRGLEVKGKEVDKCCQVVERKEKQLNERYKALVLKEQQMNGGYTELELKEKQMNDTCRELELKEEKSNEPCGTLKVKEKEVSERCVALESKGKKLNEQRKAIKVIVPRKVLKLKKKAINDSSQALGLKGGQINDHCEGFALKEKEDDERCQAVEQRELQIDERCKGMELKENEVNESRQAVEFKDKEGCRYCRAEDLGAKQINEHSKCLELKEKEINGCCQALESKENQINEICQAQELKEKQTDGQRNGNHGQGKELKQKQILVPCVTQDLKGIQVNEHLKPRALGGKQMGDEALGCEVKQINEQGDLAQELKEKQISDFCNAVEVKENVGEMALESIGKQLNGQCKLVQLNPEKLHDSCNVVARTEPCNNLVVENKGNGSGNFRFDAAIDGKTLQILLNERVNKHESMREEVTNLLKSASNPAKLVLDAVCGFFPPHLKKDNVTFKASVVRRSCVLLLEQLMDMEPTVSKVVRMEAAKVAGEWRGQMRVEGNSYTVALGFLLLVVTYQLIMGFMKDDIMRLCEMVYQHRVAHKLCQRLALLKRSNVSSTLAEVSRKQPQSDSFQVTCTGASSSMSIRGEICSFCRNMDANSVRYFLIEHVKELDVLQKMILDALRVASDPAKLVLDVCRRFHVTDLEKFRHDDNKTSCIFLLEQLTKLSPYIIPDVKDEAKNVAAVWRPSLKGGSSPIDTLGFLQFIEAYKLTSSYDADELLSLFRTFYHAKEVYRPEQTVRLCCALGLAKKIPGLIKSLIERGKHLLAVKFICVFKLQYDFPPVPLLETHLELAKKKAKERLQKRTPRAKVEAANIELAVLQDVLKCISDFKLEPEFPPNPIIFRVRQLEKEREARRAASNTYRRNTLESDMKHSAEYTSANLENEKTRGNNNSYAPFDAQGWKKRKFSLAASSGPQKHQLKRPRFGAVQRRVAPLGVGSTVAST